MARRARTDEEMVTVAVPRGVYPEVISLVSRYLAGEDSSVDPDGDPEPLVVTVPDNGTWTRADIEELYRSFRSDKGRAVIRMIAHRSVNGEVAFDSDLMDQAGLDAEELGTQFAALAKSAATIKGESVWPMVEADDGPRSPEGHRRSYHMPPEIARWWLAVDHIPPVNA